MIKTYSKAVHSLIKLSDNFCVWEFACKDGTDTVLIDEALVEKLQRIRNWAGAPVIITSGYRTPKHNAAIGGSKSSKHCIGKAADICVKDRLKSIYEIAAFAEAIGFKGIERNEDKSYVHVDTRAEKWFQRFSGGTYIPVTTYGGSCPYAEPEKNLRRGSTGSGVRWLQFWLRLWGFSVAVDGSFGPKTETAVRDLQRRRGLVVDGIAGEKTRAALKGY